MIALLTYPTRIESAAFEEKTENDSFSYRVWELHRIIADPASEAADVKNAKLRLLRTLRKSRIFERQYLSHFSGTSKKRSSAERSRAVATSASSDLEEAV